MCNAILKNYLSFVFPGRDRQQPDGEAAQAVRQDGGGLEAEGRRPQPRTGAFAARLPGCGYGAIPREERAHGVPRHAGRG